LEKMVNNAGVYYHSVTLDEENVKDAQTASSVVLLKLSESEMVKHASSIACVLTAVNVSEPALIMQKWQ